MELRIGSPLLFCEAKKKKKKKWRNSTHKTDPDKKSEIWRGKQNSPHRRGEDRCEESGKDGEKKNSSKNCSLDKKSYSRSKKETRINILRHKLCQGGGK